MSHSSSHSLVRRLTRLNLAVMAGALMLSFLLIQALVFLLARQQQREGAEAAAGVLAQNVAPMLAFEDPRATQALIDELVARRGSDLIALQVRDKEGRIYAQWRNANPNLLPRWLPGFGQQFELRAEIAFKDERLGELVWTESLQALERVMLRIWVGSWALFALTGAMAWWALRVVQRRALSPLVALTELTEQVARTQDYRLRAPVVRRDEVGRLASQVNEMLGRIDAWHADLRQQLRDEQLAGHELRRLAHRDHLTGLPNRLSFDLELERHVVQVQQGGYELGLMFIDLDHFKAINDQLGHDAGDEVLVEVTQRIHSALRAGDTLFRLGGDEFALLVAPLITCVTMEHLAERLIQAVGAPLMVRGRPMPLGASVGGALAPQHGRDASTLLRRADAAMYEAKAAGKNCFRMAGDDA